MRTVNVGNRRKEQKQKDELLTSPVRIELVMTQLKHYLVARSIFPTEKQLCHLKASWTHENSDFYSRKLDIFVVAVWLVNWLVSLARAQLLLKAQFLAY